MFSRGSLSSISFATVTPSLVINGRPELLVEDDVPALGSERHLDRVRQAVDPSEDRLPGLVTVRDLLRHEFALLLGDSPCGDSWGSPLRGFRNTLLLSRREASQRGAPASDSAEHGEDLVLAQNQDILAVDLDLGPGVLSEQDLVAHLDVQGELRPVLQDLAVPDGQHLALLGLLLGGVRDDDPSLGRLLLLDAANHQAVVKRTYVLIVCLLSGRELLSAPEWPSCSSSASPSGPRAEWRLPRDGVSRERSQYPRRSRHAV